MLYIYIYLVIYKLVFSCGDFGSLFAKKLKFVSCCCWVCFSLFVVGWVFFCFSLHFTKNSSSMFLSLIIINNFIEMPKFYNTDRAP